MQQDQHPRTGEPVGKSAMDAEHELLHRLLDDLKAELASDGPRIRELLERFDVAARAHFLEEQSLMRLHAYPGYESHQNEHDELVEELHRLSARVGAGEAVDAARLARTLDDWLTVHMHTTDAVLESYLRDHGIREGGVISPPPEPPPPAPPPRPGRS
jgi:hemerythrin-like metal-binding protein